jgi:hypothetical protein
MTYRDHDSWDSDYLDTNKAIADDYNFLPRPMALHAHCRDLLRCVSVHHEHQSELLTTIPIRQMAIYGIRAINLISASLIPLFLLVALILTQSLTGPAVSNAITAPTANEKLTNPTCGGCAKSCDCVKLNDKRQFAENPSVKAAQEMIGKARFELGQRSRERESGCLPNEGSV